MSRLTPEGWAALRAGALRPNASPSVRVLVMEVDRLRAVLQQIVWLADATEPLSVTAARHAQDALRWEGEA
jgi:hypothetical protein